MTLKDLLEKYQQVKADEDAATQLWLLVVEAPGLLQLKTTVSPSLTVQDVIRKVSTKFPSLGETEKLGLYSKEG